MSPKVKQHVQPRCCFADTQVKGQHSEVLECNLQRHSWGWNLQDGEQEEQATAHPADDPVGQAPVMLQDKKEVSVLPKP